MSIGVSYVSRRKKRLELINRVAENAVERRGSITTTDSGEIATKPCPSMSQRGRAMKIDNQAVAPMTGH